MVEKQGKEPIHDWKYVDPYPTQKGMLLSDQIRRYSENGLLIEEGYQEGNLRPAAYTLTIGDMFADSDGKRRSFKEGETSFELMPNSIVFVSAAEKLNLPFYIAARFDLRVEWVYKGILLGTGPQVDPGFRGILSCPLYNLTDRRIRIQKGDPFATIDFERTTDFIPGNTEIDQKKFFDEKIKGQVNVSPFPPRIKISDREVLLFTQKEFLPLQHHRDVIVSSLAQMEKEVRTWRLVGVGVVVAFVSLALSLLGFGANIYREFTSNRQQITDVQKGIDKAVKVIDSLSQADARAKSELDSLKSMVMRMPKGVRK